MSVFVHFFCLCPLDLTIKLNFNISKVAYYYDVESPSIPSRLAHLGFDERLVTSQRHIRLLERLGMSALYLSPLINPMSQGRFPPPGH